MASKEGWIKYSLENFLSNCYWTNIDCKHSHCIHALREE